jgi:peptidyl-prolyl cis-trans isomerase C
MRSLRLSSLLLVSALLLALGLLAAGCGGGSNSVSGSAVASVNGDDIPKSDLDALMSQAKKGFKNQNRKFPKVGSREYRLLQAQAMSYLVEKKEFDQKAKDMGIKISDKQVDQRLQQIKKQYFGQQAGSKKPLSAKQIDAAYQKQLDQQGLTDAEVRDTLRAQLVREAIFNKVTANVKVSDSDIKSYYNSHKSQYQTPKQPPSRDIRHILVKQKPLADKLYAQLKGGASFAALAKKYSQDPGSKNSGGKLTIAKGQTVPPFDKVAFALKVNELSKPVHTQYGWHIIQALGPIKPAVPAKPTPFSQVKEAIRQQLLQQKKQQVMAKWLKDLQKEYKNKVHYQAGYEPPATSSTASTAATATTSK